TSPRTAFWLSWRPYNYVEFDALNLLCLRAFLSGTPHNYDVHIMSQTLPKSQHCRKVLDKVSDEVSDKGRNRPFRDKL
ncbi:MAG TPA: hypothetical protein VNU68_05845, partial [Verrucomicrobiae bacterium]|nr:hypothetical protein [Verrucomicrobiae bacterium]